MRKHEIGLENGSTIKGWAHNQKKKNYEITLFSGNENNNNYIK